MVFHPIPIRSFENASMAYSSSRMKIYFETPAQTILQKPCHINTLLQFFTFFTEVQTTRKDYFCWFLIFIQKSKLNTMKFRQIAQELFIYPIKVNHIIHIGIQTIERSVVSWYYKTAILRFRSFELSLKIMNQSETWTTFEFFSASSRIFFLAMVVIQWNQNLPWTLFFLCTVVSCRKTFKHSTRIHQFVRKIGIKETMSYTSVDIKWDPEQLYDNILQLEFNFISR